jgi:hypothetical protein
MQAAEGPAYTLTALRVTHARLREDANAELYGGWMMVLSGLKTLLETGELLTTARLAPLLARPAAGCVSL